LDCLESTVRRDPFKSIFYFQMRGYALFDAQRYEEAIEALNQVHPKQSYDHAILGAAYAYLGKDTEARNEISALLRDEPRAAVSWFAKVEHRKDHATEERLLAGFRMAGIPE
jgi:tetratricopeptide (TPR) repeat protein